MSTSLIGDLGQVDAGHVVLDPITVEVISHAVSSIVEEMGETLVKASYSNNIKERRDCSTALFDAQGRTLAQAEHIPIHLGSLMGIVGEILLRYPLDAIQEGDAFVGNDAYTGGGTHLPDIVIATPIFFAGEIVGWASNLAHHADFVDRGGQHIFQEGLRIPPIRFQRDGEIIQDVLDLILLNCQVPDERRGDLRAQVAANRVGVVRFQGLCAKYGVEMVRATGEALLDYAERQTRAGILRIPDGVYTFSDKLDATGLDEILDLHVSITVRGDEMWLDFDGNPPQVRGGLNMVWTALLATVYYAAKTVIDPEILPNAGLYRPIHVSAPSGTILNCVPPAGVNGRTTTCQRVVDLIHGAFAEAMPDRIIAACNGTNSGLSFHGIDPRTGKFYYYMESMGGGFGARATKDGLDGVQVHITNTSNLPVECLEVEHPLLVERYELVNDSGGPGTWRGGMGIHRRVRVLDHEAISGKGATREKTAPWGLFGGLEGGRMSVTSSTSDEPVGRQWKLRAGDAISMRT
ncbi:MAG TPA: hydantoinase B/oxoprolinase family protein, partial [Thermomicrobiales bacterium]|nr:hydantoinase B/oxoprolinase family protein [Thermomicrobiales bacterium]